MILLRAAEEGAPPAGLKAARLAAPPQPPEHVHVGFSDVVFVLIFMALAIP
jgi:hypothetical protein